MRHAVLLVPVFCLPRLVCLAIRRSVFCFILVPGLFGLVIGGIYVALLLHHHTLASLCSVDPLLKFCCIHNSSSSAAHNLLLLSIFVITSFSPKASWLPFDPPHHSLPFLDDQPSLVVSSAVLSSLISVVCFFSPPISSLYSYSSLLSLSSRHPRCRSQGGGPFI